MAVKQSNAILLHYDWSDRVQAWAGNPSTQFFEKVLDSCRDLIFVKNDKFQIIYANKAMLDLYPPERRDSIVGYTTVEDFSDEEARLFLAQDREAFEVGFAQSVQKLVDHAGRTVTLVTKKTRFVEEDGNVRLIGVSTDISDLVEQTDRLTESNKTLQQFAAFVAHDLASPLATASLILQTLQSKSWFGDNDQSRAAIGDVIGVLHSSAANISSLLILQKALLGEPLLRGSVDLTKAAQRSVANLKSPIQATSADIAIDALPTLDCHPVLVETLFQNLIENSLKYRSGEAPAIRVSSESIGPLEVLSVEDNGPGMSDYTRRRVFDLFAQGDNKDAGLGIGLGLCKAITNAHGGSIWIEPDYVGGTKISFTLSGLGTEPLPTEARNRLSSLMQAAGGAAA